MCYYIKLKELFFFFNVVLRVFCTICLVTCNTELKIALVNLDEGAHKSNRSQMFFKIGVLKNFANLQENTSAGVSF